MESVSCAANTPMTQAPTLTLRPANRDDILAIANLILQLYHAELPGALRGPMAGQFDLLRYMLERGSATLFRRYMGVDHEGRVVATASFRLSRDHVVSAVPAGTMRRAVRQIGVFNAIWLFGTLLRAGMAPDVSLAAQGAYIHSVVVDEHARGRGVGGQVIDQLERMLWAEGARTAQLRVVVGNERAKRLYERLGYRVTGRTPHALDRVMFPTELMHKTLVPPA